MSLKSLSLRVGILGCLLLSPGAARGADHLDAPGVMEDGRLDLNDLYVFRSPANANNVVMIMTLNPLAGVMSPTTFNPAGIYEFRVSNDANPRTNITYQLTFGPPSGGRQSVILRRNGALLARGFTGQNVPLRAGGGGMLHCGLFDDPFFFDLLGFRDNFRFTGRDFFRGLNTSAIVLEVPRSTLGSNNVGVWARTVIGGVQFDRNGRPAINTALIRAGRKDAFNAGVPETDVANFRAEVRAQIMTLGGDPALADVLLPDLLTVDTSSPAGFLNGRRLADDVIDIALNLLTNGAVKGDGVNANDKPFRNTFPYLAAPHR